MRRRTFLQTIVGALVLPRARPRLAALLPADPVYTDSVGTADLTMLHDLLLATGITYSA